MMVEFERAVSRNSEFVPHGEDEELMEQSGQPQLISIDSDSVAAAFQSERESSATILRMKDGRSGLKVRGSYAETMAVLRGQAPALVAERQAAAAVHHQTN